MLNHLKQLLLIWFSTSATIFSLITTDALDFFPIIFFKDKDENCKKKISNLKYWGHFGINSDINILRKQLKNFGGILTKFYKFPSPHNMANQCPQLMPQNYQYFLFLLQQ